MNKITKKLLSHDETIELIKKSQAGDMIARDTLFEHNTQLVWKAVHKFKRADYNDIFQIGSIGLLKAIDKFDISFNVKFSTYAVPIILGEIQKFIRDDEEVKVSRTIKQMANNIRRLNLESYDDVFHIASLIGTDNILFVKLAIEYLTSFYINSMDAVIYSNNDGEDITLKDQLSGDINSNNWFDNIALKEAMKHLDEREALIIQMRFFKDMTQTEVAKEVGVSQVQISRQEAKIIAKLKSLMEIKEDSPKINNAIKTNRKEEIDLSKTTLSSTLVFIFKNYPDLKPKEISELIDKRVDSISSLKSKYNRGLISNTKPEISNSLNAKIKKYINSTRLQKNEIGG